MNCNNKKSSVYTSDFVVYVDLNEKIVKYIWNSVYTIVTNKAKKRQRRNNNGIFAA